MSVSASQLVLRAKQLELDALRHLADRVELLDVIGRLIDALQRERGAASVYLASAGQRFQVEHRAAMSEARAIEATLLELFGEPQRVAQGVTARTLSLMAWVTLDLEALPAFRVQIDRRIPTAHDVVAAFSRVIAGLVELVFQLADAASHPGISRQLVALVQLIQGKEAAGQERAVGAALFASGVCSEAQQLRIVKLIDAQEFNLKVFEEFAEPDLLARWQQHQLSPNVAMLERLRRSLCAAKHGAVLDTSLSDRWFEVASVRIAEFWQCEVELVEGLRQACAAQVMATEQDLRDSEGLLRQLRDNPPPHTDAVGRFFNTAQQPAVVPVLGAASIPAGGATQTSSDVAKVSSLEDLVNAQTARLASMEAELTAARRALHERKLIERAKGALMARMGLSEDAAFRALQKTAMDHNRKLVDVAEAALALPDLVFGKRTDAQQD